MRRIISAIVLTAGLVVVAPYAAGADPVGSCPGSFELVSPGTVFETTDRNDDGFVCLMTVPSGRNSVIIDNNPPL